MDSDSLVNGISLVMQVYRNIATLQNYSTFIYQQFEKVFHFII